MTTSNDLVEQRARAAADAVLDAARDSDLELLLERVEEATARPWWLVPAFVAGAAAATIAAILVVPNLLGGTPSPVVEPVGSESRPPASDAPGNDARTRLVIGPWTLVEDPVLATLGAIQHSAAMGDRLLVTGIGEDGTFRMALGRLPIADPAEGSGLPLPVPFRAVSGPEGDVLALTEAPGIDGFAAVVRDGRSVLVRTSQDGDVWTTVATLDAPTGTTIVDVDIQEGWERLIIAASALRDSPDGPVGPVLVWTVVPSRDNGRLGGNPISADLIEPQPHLLLGDRTEVLVSRVDGAVTRYTVDDTGTWRDAGPFADLRSLTDLGGDAARLWAVGVGDGGPVLVTGALDGTLTSGTLPRTSSAVVPFGGDHAALGELTDGDDTWLSTATADLRHATWNVGRGDSYDGGMLTSGAATDRFVVLTGWRRVDGGLEAAVFVAYENDLRADTDRGDPLPTDTTGREPLAGCAAAGLVSDVRDQDGLPGPVAEARRAIAAAAVACDLGRLQELAAPNGFTGSFGGVAPDQLAAFWAADEDRAAAAGGPDLPASERGVTWWMRKLLDQPYGTYTDEDGTEVYVWPRVFVEPTDAFWKQMYLEGLARTEDRDNPVCGDCWIGWRMAIRADGDWQFLVAGD